eukprot:SAG22_NODE_2574_length_2425_cov_2.925623_2_plen_142_part_00
MHGSYLAAAGGFVEPSGPTPPWPGVGLYSITKGAGAEIARIYSENHPIYHLMSIFGGVNNPDEPAEGAEPSGVGDMTTTLRDCGGLLRACIAVELGRLPSRHEVFFGKPDVPSNTHAYGKAERLLGYKPYASLKAFFTPKL